MNIDGTEQARITNNLSVLLFLSLPVLSLSRGSKAASCLLPPESWILDLGSCLLNPYPVPWTLHPGYSIYNPQSLLRSYCLLLAALCQLSFASCILHPGSCILPCALYLVPCTSGFSRLEMIQKILKFHQFNFPLQPIDVEG